MGGSGSQKTTQSLPAWATPYAQQGVESAFNYYLPGGQVGQYTGPNQSVAPLTQNQQAAFDAARKLSGDVSSLYSPYETPNLKYDPSTMNQYLEPYAKAAEQGLISEFQNATAPNIMSRAAQTGTLMSSGNRQAMGNAESALSSGLADLRARIYEPAYESAQNRGLQEWMSAQDRGLQATQGQVGGQLAANQALGQAGGQEQQQQQNVLDTAFGNAYRAFQYPQQAYQNLAGLFSGFLGNQLTTKVTGGSK